jgi:macrolide transport system ATP-binding/permease protein
MIELKDIVKTYWMGDNEVQALRGVSLLIEEGDYVAIMGPSGSGKSTLMHLLGLLDTPTSGSYVIAGHEVANLAPDELASFRREVVGFIFQQFNLLPRLDLYENVSLPLLYSRLKVAKDWVASLIARVGLKERSGHRPNELSGGQQQRVGIARALVNNPRMILADEPTGNLDSASEKDIMALLAELNSQGITVVIVTHEDEIGKQAKRLIRMRDGVVVSDERNAPLPLKKPSVSDKEQSRKPFQSVFEVFDYVRQGMRALAGNKVRTVLSMLGIMIGVAAVVTIVAIGTGAKEEIRKQLSSLGSNLLVVRPGAVRVGGVAQAAGTTTRLTMGDVTAIKNTIPNVTNTDPQVSGGAQITFEDNNWSTQVIGVGTPYETMRAATPQAGRFYTDDENTKRSRVAVIGATIVKQLFKGKNPIGETFKINKVNFQVIGILPEKGANAFRDQDDVIVVPVLTAMYRLMGKDYIDSIDVEIADESKIPAAQDAIMSLMATRHRVPPAQQQGAFQILNLADVVAAVSQSTKTMTMLLAIVAAISLLVGGIGIMNIMLVSVTERTKEIGLRKALGAKGKDILSQFLSEAVVVSLLGGFFGTVLAGTASAIISLIAGWSTSLTPFSIFLAVAFSGGIGIIFGLYPAQKASRLNPIDALRFE